MNWPAECAATIPCFNEAPGVAKVIHSTRRFLPHVIVVDDASSDGTASEARAAGAQVLVRPRRLGKGAALQSAWRQACDQGFHWALCLDGDGQHDPADIPTFFRCAEATRAELVIGNRMDNAAAMPFVRRQVNHWMSRRLSGLLGLHVPDSQCGYRLINLTAWSQLETRADHFEIESEVLLAFHLAGLRVQSVPVRTVYGAERSKISPGPDSLRWFAWWLRARKRVQERRLPASAAEACPSARL